MGVLDNASIGGYSGRKKNIILPNPEPTPQPFTGGGSSSSSTSWEDRQPPERFNVNLMATAQPQDPWDIPKAIVAKAATSPQSIAAKPFDTFFI